MTNIIKTIILVQVFFSISYNRKQKMETIASHLVPTIATGIIQRTILLAEFLMNPSSHHPLGISQVQQSLTLLDLEAKLKCWRTLVGALADRTLPLPVKISLNWFTKSIKDVEESLQLLKNAVEYHHSKYFSSWRICNFTEPLRILTTHVKILVDRETTLLQMIAIDFEKLKIEDSTTLP